VQAATACQTAHAVACELLHQDRSRVTSFDGREYVYDGKSKQVTVIDHATKRYWTGSVTLADSIVTRSTASVTRSSAWRSPSRQEEFDKFIEQFNAGIVVNQTEEQREDRRLQLLALGRLRRPQHDPRPLGGERLHHRQAAPELDRVLMAAALDPLGRQLVKMLLAGRATSRG